MATITVVLRVAKKRTDQNIPIAIRISEGNKNKYIYTGCHVLEKDWDEKHKRVKRTNIAFEMINGIIANKLSAANKAVLTIRQSVDDGILDTMQEQHERKVMNNFFKLAEDYLRDLELTEKYKRLSAEKPRVRHFYDFLGKKEISFEKIDVTLLKKFMVYLKTHRGVSDRTIMNCLVVIRTIYNLAITRKIADKNNYPFGKGGVLIKFPETAKIGLNEEEVKRIEKIRFPDGSATEHARKLWLFSFYLAGVRVSDIFTLRWEDIRDKRLVYEMGKNKKIVSLKLPNKALEILQTYRTSESENGGYVFPELRHYPDAPTKVLYQVMCKANKEVNEQLRNVAKVARISKPLTFHISRHTFGYISGDKIHPRILQKLYRHSDIKTTMGYQAHFIYKDVDEGLDKVLDF
jgi:integrase/recombinase XerD